MQGTGIEEANAVYKFSIQSVEMKWREAKMKNLATIPTVKCKGGNQHFCNRSGGIQSPQQYWWYNLNSEYKYKQLLLSTLTNMHRVTWEKKDVGLPRKIKGTWKKTNLKFKTKALPSTIPIYYGLNCASLKKRYGTNPQYLRWPDLEIRSSQK